MGQRTRARTRTAPAHIQLFKMPAEGVGEHLGRPEDGRSAKALSPVCQALVALWPQSRSPGPCQPCLSQCPGCVARAPTVCRGPGGLRRRPSSGVPSEARACLPAPVPACGSPRFGASAGLVRTTPGTPTCPEREARLPRGAVRAPCPFVPSGTPDNGGAEGGRHSTTAAAGPSQLHAKPTGTFSQDGGDPPA